MRLADSASALPAPALPGATMTPLTLPTVMGDRMFDHSTDLGDGNSLVTFTDGSSVLVPTSTLKSSYVPGLLFGGSAPAAPSAAPAASSPAWLVPVLAVGALLFLGGRRR